MSSETLQHSEARKKTTATTQQMNNSTNQHTLKGSVTLHGVGLHTGENVTMTLKPAAPGYGLSSTLGS